ncbi:unnamed protein product [Microthlaspi erraticum]|uniref:Lipoprotein n=1 Tax=Microthlaspi erraticum TaxID=1685480 RepID=A0A6D2KMW0_9BRAS|nr:unnamed protein product [Microthlaspi erraticum]
MCKMINRHILTLFVVILFLGACTKPPQSSLVTEYREKGSLYHLLYSTNEIDNLSLGEKLKIPLFGICMYFHFYIEYFTEESLPQAQIHLHLLCGLYLRNLIASLIALDRERESSTLALAQLACVYLCNILLLS